MFYSKDWIWVAFSLGISASCSGEADFERSSASEDEWSSLAQTLSRDCVGASPDEIIPGLTPSTANGVSRQSPRTYNNRRCYKAFIYQYQDLGPFDHFEAKYVEDSVNLTQSECEARWFGSYLFSDRGTGTWTLECGAFLSGVWNASQGTCKFPGATYGGGPDCKAGRAGWTYKFAGSARMQPTSAAPTAEYVFTASR
ncbi:MAG TPA: hypothetical protein VFQ61_12130 [Polyangiaceae bacterium]|nr:hypothetical protein [Polyangiaceae bacterium]